MIKIGFGRICAQVMGLLVSFPALAAIHYVDVQSTNAVAPYTNWATAARVIQDAVEVAQAGDEVLVTNGVYATGGREHPLYAVLTNRVALEKAITVRSVGGPELTWIVGQGAGGTGTNNGNGAVRCAYVGANAVLSGFTLTNGHTSTIGSNPDHQNGGGAWCETGGVLTNCTLTGNSASYAGGGACGGMLINCTLIGNTATRGGGAYGGTLNRCTLTGNGASYSGGGAYGGVLNQCLLTGNWGRYAGGGAYDGMLTACTMTNNSAQDGGGASGGILNECIVSDNSASEGGGVIGSVLTNCAVTGNFASGHGGGAYGGALNNCSLMRNSSSAGGGAYCSALNICTLTGNSAGIGGGAYNATLTNCTVTGNSAIQNGGGACGGMLNNCIVYHNTASLGPNHNGSSFVYSCTTPLPEGPGNIDADPWLASAAHLSAQSPCIGRGNPEYALGVDIDGEPWLNPPCMGADQFIAGAATGELSVFITAAWTNAAVGFPFSFAAQNTGPVTATVWEFGDGVVVSNNAYTSHSWSTPGSYQVRLTGYNDTYLGGITATVLVQVAEQAVYYVNASNPAPVYPHTNWAGAATTIQEAIDAGTQLGRLVRVTNGVYDIGGRAVYGQMTNRVVVPEGVKVRSENGPLVTIIAGQPVPGTTNNGNGAIRCVYVGTNAVLSGFTLTNGHTRITGNIINEGSGGGAWCEVSGLLTNCILIGNSANSRGGGDVGGILNDCALISNSGRFGGGVNGGILNRCTVTGNVAQYGGGIYGSALTSCTVTGNVASSSGGGVYGDTTQPCIVNNCTLVGNSAQYGGGANGGTLKNCTLVGNSAAYGGGGTCSSELLNCIVYYNMAPTGTNDFGSRFAYSCTMPLPTDGIGNLTNAPIFVNAAAGDYRLAWGSPGIDAGTNVNGGFTRDLADNPRPLDGNGDGVAICDMGAYEFDWRTAVPADWLAAFGLATNDFAILMADHNGNGLTTVQEYIAGLCPTNAGASFHIDGFAASASNGSISLQIDTVSSRRYTLEYCTDLGQPNWQAVSGQSDLPGNDGVMTFTDPSATPPRFYRVTVRLP